MSIRTATLDDTVNISALFRARVERWQRINVKGQVEDLPYDRLSIYDRWLHGGPWMSVETGAIWVSHLLSGAGMPLVLEQRDQIIAYAEVFSGTEPDPIGPLWHLEHLVVHPECNEDDVKSQLMQHLLEATGNSHRRLTAACAGYDTEQAAFYQRYDMQPLTRVQQYTIAAKTGQSFYRANEHPDANPQQIEGWFMSIGRASSARHQWETNWPYLWQAVPAIKARSSHRLNLFASGQNAFLCCQQQLYDPRSADVYCWSPKPLTAQLLIAIRDWAHRAGFRNLALTVDEKTARLLGNEGEANPYIYDIYATDR